jgi:hypothetical protein
LLNDQAVLFRYGTTLKEELSAVVWVPPFTQPLSIKATPIKARHQCSECGKEHTDQRTKPANRSELRARRCTMTEELAWEAPPVPL